MFLIFIGICYGIEEIYSLIPPLVQTNVSEIGHWSLRGSATNMKKHIRLTSNLENQFGSACSRVPTTFRDWSVELEIKSHGGDGGQGIWVYFTEEVCPIKPTKFTGFAFWINTSMTDRNGLSPVYFYNNSNVDIDLAYVAPIGHVNLRSNESSLSLTLQKYGDRIVLDTLKRDVRSNKLFESYVTNLQDFGYFTVSATTEKKTDNNDLVAFRVFKMSNDERSLKDKDYTDINRKLIDKMKGVRKERKELRRLSMPKAEYFLKQINESMADLLRAKPEYIDEAFKIITETENRIKQGIKVDSLFNFIQTNVDESVKQAYDKINLATQKFVETNHEIDEMWSNLKTQLLSLQAESRRFMTELQAEVSQIIEVKLNSYDQSPNSEKLNEEAQNVNDNVVHMFVVVISIIEFVCFCFFFFIQHQKTSGFKKRD